MPTTSNFGWTTPADTDLVKDGAAAIRTLGNGVDTSFVDLKGGTSGQILAKNSNTDLDFVWIANDQGDITAVTAGTGISGGGTTGAVTITNSMATEITASGDIIVGTGSGTFDNLPIGSTGQVLTADTTVSPYKVKWAAPAAPSFVGCSLVASADTTIATGTLTAVAWNTEDFDTDGFHDNVTNNSRITIPSGKAGKYQVNAMIRWDDNATAQREILIYKNGAVIKQFSMAANNQYPSINLCVILNLSVSDYLQVYAYQTSGGTRNLYPSGAQGHFSVGLLGA